MQTTSLFRRAAALALTLVLAVSASLAGFATYDMPIQTVSDTESVYLFNLDTGKPILDQNAGQSRYIASLTKMMTALLFLESGKDLNEEITIPTSLTQEFKDIQNANGSTMNLRIGETVRRMDLLYGLLVASANDAASVIASDVSGGNLPAFVSMMTALLVLESGADLNESITIPDSLTPEFQAIRANRGHTIGLQAGESVRRLDMLYAMLVPSANDAASVLASDAAGGDLAAFAARMNARASQLGCTNTHFTCPHGLYDHNNYSTARDMAKIALACHANGTYMQVANTVSYTLPATNLHPARNISSTNRLLKPGSAYYRGYAQGMKTGFTTQAGRCFVTFASQNGRTYGLVILGSNSQNIFREAAELFDWAFSNPDLQPKAAAPETKKHSLFSFWQNLLG